MARKTWFELHPEDAQNFLDDVKRIRAEKLNAMASTPSKVNRYLGTIPADLYYHIMKQDPTIFESKAKARKFFIDNPEFRIPDQI